MPLPACARPVLRVPTAPACLTTPAPPTRQARRYQGSRASSAPGPPEGRLARPLREERLSTAPRRSSVSNSGGADPPVRSSAPRTPCSRKARTICLVAWWARVGPAASRARSASTSRRARRPAARGSPRSSAPASRRRRGRRSSRTRGPAPARHAPRSRCVPPISGVSPTTASTSPNAPTRPPRSCRRRAPARARR